MLKGFSFIISCVLITSTPLVSIPAVGSAKEIVASLLDLAKGCKELGQYEEAATLYQSVVAKGEDPGEVWLSKYMIAECHELMGHWEEALYHYLEAFQYNPNRTEPLLKIARYYRYRGENNLAFLFAKHGSLIPFLKDQIPSLPDPMTPYQFDEEISIAAYYTRFREEGKRAINDLILRKNVPGHLKDNSYQNLLFYIENLPSARYVPIKYELPLIHPASDEQYHPMNPSIIKTENGYQLILRGVNYTQQGAKIFKTTDPTGVFRTKNFLISYDKNFAALSQQEIIENLPRNRARAFNVDGIEDCRIFEWNGKFWFTCTTFDTSPHGTIQVSLCEIENQGDPKKIHVERLIPLKGPDPYRCEKNWLPFVSNGDLHVVYASDPLTIYRPNLQTGECETVLRAEQPLDFSRFRGSAAPIPFDEGYLMLVHEVAYLQDYFRCYLHRFVYLDKNFSFQKLSTPFTFLHQGVEFCPSMTIDHSGNELILPIGSEDHQAFLCFVELDTVRSLLKPLPNLPAF